MLSKNLSISIKISKILGVAQLLFIICILCVLSDISMATYDSSVEKVIESKTPKTRYELRKILTDIFPESYIFNYSLMKEVITYSLDSLETKLASDKNTENSHYRSRWNNRQSTTVPVWGNISIHKSSSIPYKYYPPASSRSTIASIGLEHRLLLYHRIGLMMNYVVSTTKISNTIYDPHLVTTLKDAKLIKQIQNHGLILALYYQYQNTKISVDCSFLVGERQQKSNKKIDWLQADYKSYYKSKLYSANVGLNYPCFINNIYLDIILRNNINIFKNPDVSIKDISAIKHSEIKLLKTGTGIRASYNFQATTKFNIYSSIMFIYNYSFYLEGSSKIDIMYLGKDFYIKNYLLEKRSFNTNLDIIVKTNGNFNIGLNLTWIKEKYASSLGGRLLLYYCF
jgi:hypothetical protein